MVSKKQGAKYGLIQPKQAAQPLKPSLAVFGDEDEPADYQRGGVARDVARQADKKRADAKVAAQQAAALADDPTVFDYDGVYDDLQQQRTQPKQSEKLERKSRYIEGLLDKAKERQREQDIVYERRLAKERQAEDHLFGDKDAFVTGAYKKKLQEDQMWLAEERVREEMEKREDVVKKGHMGDFYGNLMRNNVAFGTAGERAKPAAAQPVASAAAPESAQEAHAPAERDQHPAATPPAAARMQAVPEPSQAAEPVVDSLTGNEDDERERRPAQAQLSEPGVSPAAARSGPESAPAAAPAQQVAAEQVGADAAEETQPPAPTKEEKLMSARDRYLARKRKGPDS